MSSQKKFGMIVIPLLLGTMLCGRLTLSGTSLPTTSTPTLEFEGIMPTPLPAAMTAAETLDDESPRVRLSMYNEHQDGSLEFWIYIVNPSLGPWTDSRARVVLYDASGASLIENQKACGHIEKFSECWVVINFDSSSIPDDYAAYNIDAEVTTPNGETLTARLSDHPLSGEEGVAISEGRELPRSVVFVNWELPKEGYRPGKDVQAQMEIMLSHGQLGQGQACLRVTELRRYASGQQDYVTLAERCEQVSPRGEGTEKVTLGFKPSGFTWISQESPGGTYTPLELKVQATFKYHDLVLAEEEKVLHLPPIEVISGWWERGGVPIDKYETGEWYTANIVFRALADDPLSHTLQLSVRYTEQDPEEWLLGGLLLFIPCLFGLCTDEAEMLTQTYDIQLVADEEIKRSVRVQTPAHPTGEIGVGGYFYLALMFDGITIWRGGNISPAYAP